MVYYFINHERNGNELPSTLHDEDNPLEDKKMLQEGSKARKKNPLIDYTRSCILTSTLDVKTLRNIANKIAEVELQREKRARIRKLTKLERAKEKLK